MAMRSSNNSGDHEVIRPIAEFYTLISGDQSDKRDWEAISRLFVGGARLSVVTDSESRRLLRMNVREYLTRLSDYLSDKSFHERGSDFDVFVSNDIASVRSVYKARVKQESGETLRSGVNLVQLIRAEEQWKIISMLWQDDL